MKLIKKEVERAWWDIKTKDKSHWRYLWEWHKRNEEEFKETKKENHRLYEQEIEGHTVSRNKKNSDAETKYQNTTQEIEKEYQITVQSSNYELVQKLKLAAGALEIQLEANERFYNAQLNAYKNRRKRANIRENWAESDAEAKQSKIETETAARSENIDASRGAQRLKNDKSIRASRDKQSIISQAEEDIKLDKTKSSEKVMN